MATPFTCHRSAVERALLLAASLAAIAGCRAPDPQPGPAAGPPAEEAIPEGGWREWWMIYNVELRNLQRIRTPVGYLEHWFDRDRQTLRYWVRDLANRKRGFLLPPLQAFQVVETRDIYGKAVIESRFLGTFSLEEGIRRILEIAAGSIEIEKMREQTAPPAAAKSP